MSYASAPELSAHGSAGTIVIRLHQNRDGVVLPPDLGSALRAPNTVEKGKLITLLDIDHFHVCDSVEYSDAHIENVGWKLKSGAFDVFADHIVTPHALEVWK